ncbi:MAG: hypothetical protein CBC29_06985 [Methylococcaceae bacterium TMED69]|nr:MAG: hypothetical protein CBC29_06985 [Methylococcaceae bacterium TMED69]|tara:strand:+ start:140 stop:409 length:270 start_codon:yes stop_codon:yes gene_type:complete
MLNIQVGPFAKAEKFAASFAYGLARSYAFQQILKEMEDIEKLLEETENEEEIMLAKMIYEQLEEQLNVMISHPEPKNERPRNNKSNPIP